MSHQHFKFYNLLYCIYMKKRSRERKEKTYPSLPNRNTAGILQFRFVLSSIISMYWSSLDISLSQIITAKTPERSAWIHLLKKEQPLKMIKIFKQVKHEIILYLKINEAVNNKTILRVLIRQEKICILSSRERDAFSWKLSEAWKNY